MQVAASRMHSALKCCAYRKADNTKQNVGEAGKPKPRRRERKAKWMRPQTGFVEASLSARLIAECESVKIVKSCIWTLWLTLRSRAAVAVVTPVQKPTRPSRAADRSRKGGLASVSAAVESATRGNNESQKDKEERGRGESKRNIHMAEAASTNWKNSAAWPERAGGKIDARGAGGRHAPGCCRRTGVGRTVGGASRGGSSATPLDIWRRRRR
jgi:hypothetical protein